MRLAAEALAYPFRPAEGDPQTPLLFKGLHVLDVTWEFPEMGP